ncbi:MAG: hypothetical protein JOZ57_11240, partial [Abitibacteriaceae bacterium]|nr:hypothetical protein [Abditibacteriaceae bacterium]
MTGSEVNLWSVPGGKPVRHLTVEPHEMVLGLAFAPDGKTLAGGSIVEKDGAAQGQVRLWIVGTGIVKKTIAGLQGSPGGLAYSPDGKWLAAPTQVVQGDKVTASEVRLWNSDSGQLAHTFSIPGVVVEALAFTPDAKALAIKAATVDAKGEVGYSTVKLWDVTTGKLQWNFDEVGVSSLVQSIAFSGDGKWFVAAGVSFGRNVRNRIWVWSMTPDANGGLNLVNTWTPTSQNPDADDLANPSGGLVAALAPDDKTVAVGLGTGDVQLIDLQTGQVLRTFTNPVE